MDYVAIRHEFRACERRAKVATLYLQGWSQSAMARECGVTQQQISLDLHVLQKAWLTSTTEDFSAVRAKDLAKLDEMERAAWEAWHRSKHDQHISTTEESTSGELVTRKTSKRTVGQSGDPAFLAVILKCVERRAALLGLDAPKRFKLDLDALTDEELHRLAQGDFSGLLGEG